MAASVVVLTLASLVMANVVAPESDVPADPSVTDLVAAETSVAPSSTAAPEPTRFTLSGIEDSPLHPFAEPSPLDAPKRDLTSTTVVEPDTGGQRESSQSNSSSKPSPSPTAAPAPKSDSGPLEISGQSGVVYENLKISNPGGPCVRVVNSSNVVIRNSEIGPCGGRGVSIEKSSSVTVENVSIHHSSAGVYAVLSQAIVVSSSSFTHAGRNFVQFDKVTGAGNKIVGNSGSNSLGGSNAEDLISLYQSSGTSGSPIEVKGNRLSNGGPSGSGSGIMVGDSGGSHVVVSGNTLTDPGQVGIGVAGGSNMRVVGNVIYSSAHPWSNVGIYVWNQSGSCGNIEVSGNRVEWYNSGGASNGGWDGGGCGSVAGWDSNDWNADL
jgi:hypothetical protein